MPGNPTYFYRKRMGCFIDKQEFILPKMRKPKTSEFLSIVRKDPLIYPGSK